jgi:hypothetical protein
VSAAYELLQNRIVENRTIERLFEALSPGAAVQLEHRTPLAEAWRKYREADIAAGGEIIEQGGDRHPPEVEQAIHDRDELQGLFLAMPSTSPADALVRLMYVALDLARDTRDHEGNIRTDYVFNSSCDEVMLEAMLDLLQPGVLKRIADGLGGAA